MRAAEDRCAGRGSGWRPRWLLVLALLAPLWTAAPASALDLGRPGDLLYVDVHAFVSQGFVLSAHNDYLAGDTTRGSFQFSEVGLNVTKPIMSNLRVGMQLFAQDLGPLGNYSAKFDWFYLDYRWRDWLGFRAGRLKIPYGLYNEINDVDSARVAVLLPQSVYPMQTRHFLFAQTGGELYGFARLGAAGALDYRAFAGTIFVDVNHLLPPNAPFDLTIEVPYVVGGRLLWETPLEGLRLGASFELVTMDADAVAGEASVWIDNRSMLGVASAEYRVRELTLAAEYSRWHSKQWSNEPSNRISAFSERAYAMVAHRATTWLQSGIYYAILYPDTEQREGTVNKQHDLALTVRFDVNPYWLIKLEGHYMEGAAALNTPLRVGPPITEAARTWGVFLVKTTGYF